MPLKGNFKGFTLAELLIALAILGVIATFTIPKVLQNQRNQTYNTAYKEALSTIAAAYQQYQIKHGPSVNMTPWDLTPYINYVTIDTSSTIDEGWGQNSPWYCAWAGCLKLHSGALIYLDPGVTFGAASPNNFIYFKFDPDGQYTGQANGPGQAMDIDLYYNGQIVSSDLQQAGSIYYSSGTPQTYNGWYYGVRSEGSSSCQLELFI